MGSPRVSIITPAYNHERFIAECVESVLCQSVGDWEMIVVDDGSTDETPSILSAFTDPRIQVIRQENKGLMRLSETYNSALEMAKGEFVAILEGDDTWPWHKLEAQLGEMEDPEAALCFGQFSVVDEEGSISSTEPKISPPTAALRNEPVGRGVYYLAKPSLLTFAFPVTLLMRTEALRRVGGFHQTTWLPLVDYPTLLHMSLAGPWRYHEAVVGYWRRHGGSTTLSRLPEILNGAIRCSREFIAQHRGQLPLTDSDFHEITLEQMSFQHERAMLAHRWALSEGRIEDAQGHLAFAGRMAVGKAAKARVALAKILMKMGRSTEPVASLKRRPWQEAVKLNAHDTLVHAATTPNDLDVI
jgi:hypothetical protein